MMMHFTNMVRQQQQRQQQHRQSSLSGTQLDDSYLSLLSSDSMSIDGLLNGTDDFFGAFSIPNVSNGPEIDQGQGQGGSGNGDNTTVNKRLRHNG
jgi:hypothetical protein